MSNAAPTTNPNDVTIRRIFNHLDRRAPSDARNIRSAFDDLWDNLYYLSEYLEDAARRFDREERDLMMAEYNRVQSAIAVMGQSSLPVIMPDGSDDETPAQPAAVATPSHDAGNRRTATATNRSDDAGRSHYGRNAASNHDAGDQYKRTTQRTPAPIRIAWRDRVRDASHLGATDVRRWRLGRHRTGRPRNRSDLQTRGRRIAPRDLESGETI